MQCGRSRDSCSSSITTTAKPRTPNPHSPPPEPVFASIDEKLSCTLSRQGGVESIEVQGTLSLVVGSDADAFIRAKVRQGANAGYQFKTHPNIDKAGYNAEGLLGLKDPARPFPTGEAVFRGSRAAVLCVCKGESAGRFDVFREG